MSRQVCRWGILSAANIARKNWLAIRNCDNAVVTAVASRDKAKAQQFIDECNGHSSFNPKPIAIGSYEELLKSPEIDAVYLPVPTGVRKDWVIKAAEAGKHVLAEKTLRVYGRRTERDASGVQEEQRSIHGRRDVHA